MPNLNADVAIRRRQMQNEIAERQAELLLLSQNRRHPVPTCPHCGADLDNVSLFRSWLAKEWRNADWDPATGRWRINWDEIESDDSDNHHDEVCCRACDREIPLLRDEDAGGLFLVHEDDLDNDPSVSAGAP